MKPARTRFAPSPTGFLHVGNVRTALFAWLVARHSGGQFLVRLEDTDQQRYVPGSANVMTTTLAWLGLDIDEGFGKAGDEASWPTFTQSRRLPIYKEWAEKLIAKGRAYADPTPPEAIQKLREQAQQAKRPFIYRGHRPENPPEWDGSSPLRFKSDPKAYDWEDAVMGKLHAGAEAVDDFIIMKSDGYPTYNFAHIVDDALMEITHVIRGQEYVASMPNYLNLYEALELSLPIFATLPHILAESGNKKLSKRDGAKSVLDYRAEGYLPEAMVNFLASLGWNDGTEQEIFSAQELIKKFSLDRVQRSGARFDERRLVWMDGAHIRELALDELYKRSEGFWPSEADRADESFKKQVLGLVQERLKYLSELPELTTFFFVDLPVNPELISNNKQLGKLHRDELTELLGQAKTSLEQSDFSHSDLEQRLNELLEATGQKPSVLFSLIRIATTQAPASPGLADTLAVLGKKRSLNRLNTQLAAL